VAAAPKRAKPGKTPSPSRRLQGMLAMMTPNGTPEFVAPAKDSCAAEEPGCAGKATQHQPIVSELIALLQSRPDLAEALKASIRQANRPGVGTLAEYYDFLNEMVTLIPTDRNLNAFVLKFYYLIDLSPGGFLQADASFQRWAGKFAADWGAFLDTTESATGITGFFSDPSYHIEDYYVAPSGWLTFNQFFARQVRPGKRPIEGGSDDRVIVSPADSVFQGQWPITSGSKITAKGLTWSVIDLLAGSPDQNKFRGGVFTHSFLNVNDYHWFHVPVGGVVKEVRKIPGKVSMDVIKQPDGSLDIVDGTGYQFTQDRGLIILDTALGLIAILPIGMAQVSSVNLTAGRGATLAKGEAFGFFAFGGSDIVMLFEAGKVQLEANVGTHYNQGRRIGRAAADLDIPQGQELVTR
jgi:phosphatidylserine decarboxylase precursor